MQRRRTMDDPHCSLVRQDGRGAHYGSLSEEAIEIPQPSDAVLDQKSTANVFSDGCMRIDFVLVWETVPWELSGQQDSHKNRDLEERSATIHRTWWKKFLDRLHAAGIHMEKHMTCVEKKVVHYLLLSASWSVLCYYTELQLHVPLQALPRQTSNWSANVLQRLGIPNLMAQEVPKMPLDYNTCPFKANKLHWFLGSDEQDTFFSTTQRLQILYEILAMTQYCHSREQEVGVDQLLSENVFTAAFPLHDGPYKLRPGELAGGSLSQCQVLFQYWASWGKRSKYQLPDHVRKYCGEKVAFYFSWLGFYTGWLLPAAVVGTVVFIASIFPMFNDVPSQEICVSEEQYWMFPLCKTCPYWQLSKICRTFMVGQLFDHGGTIFFSTFMSLWAVLFLEFWKRTSTSLAHHWDCSEFEDIEIAMVVMFMASIILYQAVVAILLSSSGYFWSVALASCIASITGSVVNLIFILILSKIYISLAHFLTKWEMQRTQTKYEDAFTFKVFVFQFVTFYSSLIYIAFFKGKFIGYPGNYLSFLGVCNEECSPGGCFIELAQELLVIMVGKQIIKNVQEVAIPKLKCWWHKHKLLSPKKAGKEGESVLVEQAPWVMDHQLLVFEELFDEYLEMVLQFSFITIFVEACPLAPLFALFNNWVEICLDAHKFVCDYRRPVAERAQGISIWFSILEVITHLAIISNAFLIAFTSDFLPSVYYKYVHDSSLRGYVNFTLAYAPWDFVLQSNTTCRHAIAWLVPDIPESVEVKVKRERYLPKEALAENKVLLERQETSKASVMDLAAGRDWETEQFQFASSWVPQHALRPVARCRD